MKEADTAICWWDIVRHAGKHVLHSIASLDPLCYFNITRWHMEHSNYLLLSNSSSKTVTRWELMISTGLSVRLSSFSRLLFFSPRGCAAESARYPHATGPSALRRASISCAECRPGEPGSHAFPASETLEQYPRVSLDRHSSLSFHISTKRECGIDRFPISYHLF